MSKTRYGCHCNGETEYCDDCFYVDHCSRRYTVVAKIKPKPYTIDKESEEVLKAYTKIVALLTAEEAKEINLTLVNAVCRKLERIHEQNKI